jgi:ATP-dependent Clp protease ATP-binding subunit ClpX
MLDVMFDIPSRKNAKEVVVSEDTIVRKVEPVVMYASDEPKKEIA